MVSHRPASVNVMVNAELRMLTERDGTAVCNVSFDLSANQLSAAAQAVEEVRLARHRGRQLGTDDVLSLRELTSVSDELHRLVEHDAHANVVLPLARFAALHDALAEWVHDLEKREWKREDEAEALPVVDALLEPMAALRAEALEAVLGPEAAQPRER